MGTPHNTAQDGAIAETILLPGDPLRAKFIADNFLEDAIQFNEVRNMLGYTGTYQGKRVSVMGTGMGCPSIGIYTYELIHFYGVKKLIRIGSCGAIQKDLQLGDIVMAIAASTDSNFAHQYRLPGTFSAAASYELLHKAVNQRKGMDTVILLEMWFLPIFFTAIFRRMTIGRRWVFWLRRWRVLLSTATRQGQVYRLLVFLLYQTPL